MERTSGQAFHKLLDQRETFLHLADANPNARVHIAFLKHGYLEFQISVGCIGDCSSRIEGSARTATNIAAGSELPGQGRREVTGRDRTILERSRIVVNLDQLRKALPDIFEQPAN